MNSTDHSRIREYRTKTFALIRAQAHGPAFARAASVGGAHVGHNVAVGKQRQLRLVQPGAVRSVEDVRRPPVLPVVVGRDDYIAVAEQVVGGVAFAHSKQLPRGRNLDPNARAHRQARYSQFVVQRHRSAERVPSISASYLHRATYMQHTRARPGDWVEQAPGTSLVPRDLGIYRRSSRLHLCNRGCIECT